MDQESTVAPVANITTLARKSWTAYVRITFIGLLLLAIVVPIAWQASPTAGAITLVVVLDMARGHEAVMNVNALHQTLVRENRLA